MNRAHFRTWPHLVAALVVALFMCVPISAQVSEEVLDSISTPNEVETRIGTLEFFDGIPTKETAKLLYDNLDFLRGVETFLNGMPAASVEGLRRGHESLGVESSNQVVIFDQLMDSQPLFLTGNTDTVYCSALSRPREGRSDGDRDPAQDRPGDGQRRLLPLRDRHGLRRPRQRARAAST